MEKNVKKCESNVSTRCEGTMPKNAQHKSEATRGRDNAIDWGDSKHTTFEII
jgi:hypothetical protein